MLTINEYGLEYGNQVESDRRYLFLKLLERLKRAGAPLDNVGLQSHLDHGKGPLAEPEIERMLREIAGMGLAITVTELDVKEAEPGRPVAERDQRAAAAIKQYLEIVLDQPAVRGVVTWGLSDRHSWLSEGGAINRGLPFDPEMRPTPVFSALLEAFGGGTGARVARSASAPLRPHQN
jgi:endo-1,4-beta-xylanase